MLPFVPAGDGPVLDVGCAAGRFGEAIKAREPGRVVWGVEPDGGAADSARAVLDRVVTGSYPEVVPELGRRFDAVVFNDVLEHLVDPWSTLAITREAVLGGGGRVVACIPNARNWRTLIDLARHGRFPYEASGIHDVDHLRWFTRRTAVEAFEQAGYVVERVEMVRPLGYRRARAFGRVLGPIAPGLAEEADFRQIALVARSAGTAG